MLDLSKCELIETRTHSVAAGVSKIIEGTPMVFAMENGKSVVKAATGASGEKFAGVAMSRFISPDTAVATLETVVPATPFVITLPKTPTGNPSILINGTAATFGTAATGVVNRSGATLTFHSSDAGKAVQIVYRYALTLAEAQMLYGNDIVFQDHSLGVKVGLVSTGLVYVDTFDEANNWNTIDAVVKLGAGKFTTGGSGTTLHAVVEEAPVSSGGLLGLRLQPAS